MSLTSTTTTTSTTSVERISLSDTIIASTPPLPINIENDNIEEEYEREIKTYIGLVLEEEKCPPSSPVSQLSELTNEEKKEILNTDKECPICLEKINSTNNLTTTPCGHSFCFNCIFKNINSKKSASYNKCPCCREILDNTIKNNEDEEDLDNSDDDYDEEDDDEYDDEEDLEYEESELYKYDIDEIITRFVKKGYSFKDAIAVYLDGCNLKNYAEEHYEKVIGDLDEIINELQDENYELYLMRKEDRICDDTQSTQLL
jgi:hypothetical protein